MGLFIANMAHSGLQTVLLAVPVAAETAVCTASSNSCFAQHTIRLITVPDPQQVDYIPDMVRMCSLLKIVWLRLMIAM